MKGSVSACRAVTPKSSMASSWREGGGVRVRVRVGGGGGGGGGEGGEFTCRILSNIDQIFLLHLL